MATPWWRRLAPGGGSGWWRCLAPGGGGAWRLAAALGGGGAWRLVVAAPGDWRRLMGGGGALRPVVAAALGGGGAWPCSRACAPSRVPPRPRHLSAHGASDNKPQPQPYAHHRGAAICSSLRRDCTFAAAAYKGETLAGTALITPRLIYDDDLPEQAARLAAVAE